MATPSKRRFDLRKSPFDGKWRRWEQVPQGELFNWPCHPDTGNYPPGAKALIWVVTGVFESRNAAFRDVKS